jgi:hypothetical protein
VPMRHHTHAWGARGAHGTFSRLHEPGQRAYRGGMDDGKPESKFVRLIMAGASEVEIEEATRCWFAYLRLLDAVANDADISDSRTNDSYVRFDNEPLSDL